MQRKRGLTNWLKSYMAYTQHSEAPDLFHFWTGVSTVAGALRRRVWIDQRYFQWTPNFYIIFVAPPGVVSKSTTANIGMRLLRKVNGVNFGPDSMTWQSLTKSLSEAHEMVQMEDGNFHPMSCITVCSSELGSFLNPQDREMVDVLVDLWDSRLGVWERKTKTQGEDTIENPWINVIGCTTPGWIKDNMPEYVIAGGFASRCVFVYAEEKRRFVAYPSEEIQSEEFKRLGEELIYDLEIISGLKGQYHMEADALKWGMEWYEEHWTKRPIHLSHENFAGYISRKQTHIHKLAMVIAASQRNDLVITADDLQVAHKFVTGLEKDMAKIFEQIGMTDKTRSIATVIATVRLYKKITKTELYRLLYRRIGTKDEFDSCVTSAVHSGEVRQTQEGNDLVLRPVHHEQKA